MENFIFCAVEVDFFKIKKLAIEYISLYELNSQNHWPISITP